MFKSRWGFYSCSFELFLKLKRINKFYQQALRQRASWVRWERKEPHNRIVRARIRNSSRQVIGYQAPIPALEPSLNGFLQKIPYKSRQDRRGTYLKEPMDRENVCFTRDMSKFIGSYYQARYPQASADLVKPLLVSENEINDLLKLCEN